jgi:hypothetical protein
MFLRDLYIPVWVIWLAFGVGIGVTSFVYVMGHSLLRLWTERRGSERRWGNPIEVRMKGFLNREEAVAGLVINRSKGGLAVVLDESVDPGTFLRIRPTEAPTDIPWAEVEVRHCRSAGKNWIIGCKFVGEVPWATKLWFG